MIHTISVMKVEKQKRVIWTEGIGEISMRDMERELALKMILKDITFINHIKYI